MIGKYEIEVYNNRVHYFLTVKRNITILQGNSATGKTELIRLIQEHEANGQSSGVTLICDVKCTVLTTVDWELRLKALSNHIVFIDETAAFLRSKRFAELVRGSDNYFVIVSRDDLDQLPYSVDEIYGLKNVSESQKYKSYKQIYNEMYKLYNYDFNKPFVPEIVVTEDSNSGYEFFCIIYPDKCVSAYGKSNIYETVRKAEEKSGLIIVDGAAFGPQIGKLMRYLETSKVDFCIYAPESFEYLILKSGLLDVHKDVVEATYMFADSCLYMSWEEFYTKHLSDITRNTAYQYGKSQLAPAYKKEGAIARIKSSMPDAVLDMRR